MNETNTDRTEQTTENDSGEATISRRTMLTGAFGLAAAGSAGFFVGQVQAADPAGEVGTSTNPYLRAYVDRMVFTPRSSDPSSPADGTLWYNSSG